MDECTDNVSDWYVFSPEYQSRYAVRIATSEIVLTTGSIVGPKDGDDYLRFRGYLVNYEGFTGKQRSDAILDLFPFVFVRQITVGEYYQLV